MEVKVSSYTGVQNPWKKIPVLNVRNTLRFRDAAAAGQPKIYDNPAQYGEGTDWQSHVFNPNAIMQSSDVSIAGATNKVRTCFCK